MRWLSEEWKSAWRWAQTWLGVFIVASSELYNQFALIRETLPAPVARWGTTALGILVLINTIRKKPG